MKLSLKQGLDVARCFHSLQPPRKADEQRQGFVGKSAFGHHHRTVIMGGVSEAGGLRGVFTSPPPLPPWAPLSFCSALSAAPELVSSSPLAPFVPSSLVLRCRWHHHRDRTHTPLGTSPGCLAPHLHPEGPHGCLKGAPCEGTHDAEEPGSLLRCQSLWQCL